MSLSLKLGTTRNAMYRPTANELKILIALKEVGEAESMRVGSKIGMGASMADYLCRYLATLVKGRSTRKEYEFGRAL